MLNVVVRHPAQKKNFIFWGVIGASAATEMAPIEDGSQIVGECAVGTVPWARPSVVWVVGDWPVEAVWRVVGV